MNTITILGIPIADALDIYLSFIVSAVAVVFSAKTFFFDKKKLKTTKAIELSKEYSVLLKSIVVVLRVVNSHTQVMEIINKRERITKKLSFSLREIETLYSPHEISILDDFFSGKTIDPDITRRLLKYSDAPLIYKICIDDNTPDDIVITVFKDLMMDTLNSLEYFSMNFTFGIANDNIIYQSLHQTFFTIVNLLYYKIASMNTSVQDKYFTNVIALYNSWVKKETKLNNKVERKISKIVNPKRKM